MNPDNKTTTAFSRPLIEFSAILLDLILPAEATLDGIDETDLSTDLKQIQAAYERIPRSDSGEWFLRTADESSRRHVTERCREVASQVDRIVARLDAQEQPDESVVLMQLGQLLRRSTRNVDRLGESYQILRDRPTPAPETLRWPEEPSIQLDTTQDL